MNYSILLHDMIALNGVHSNWSHMGKYIADNGISRLSQVMTNLWCWNFKGDDHCDQYIPGDGDCVYIKFDEAR